MRPAALWIVLLGAVAVATLNLAAAQERDCGTSPDDWCAAPPGDPCGRHKNAAECRADFKCNAVPFRGVTKIACITDRRGFSLNCPTVGCRSAPAGPGK
jgi:hypothetical protein